MSYTRTPDPRRVLTRAAEPVDTIGPVLGLTQYEAERASIAGFVRAVAADDKAALGFYRDVSDRVVEKTQRQTTNFLSYAVPGDALARRDLSKGGGGSAGGYLVGTGVEAFTSELDKASVLMRLPVTRIPNLIGDATISRESAKGSAGWLASETSTIPDAQSTYGSIALTPKTISAVLTVGRQFALQTQFGPQIEAALATLLGEAVDAAVVNGSGASGQPSGIATLAGTDTRTGASFTHAMAAAMDKVASGYAASSTKAWIAGVDAAEDLVLRERATGSGFIADGGQILGSPLYVSRSIGAQQLVVMPWSQCWFASWGSLEIAVDPFTEFKAGKVLTRVLWSVDFGFERPASIAIATAVS